MSFPKAPNQSEIISPGGRTNGVWSQWFDRAQNILNLITGSGASKNRPETGLYIGAPYFDTSINRPVFWNGSSWVSWPDRSTVPSTMGFYYGSFYDTNTSQLAANITTAYPIKINTTAEGSGVTIENDSSGNPTLIKFANTGTYNIQYSIQFTNTATGNANYNADVWFRLNEADISNSNSIYWIPQRNGSINGDLIAACNLVTSLNSGDYVQLMWSPNTTDISIATFAAGTTPTVPVTPGVILTACQVR